MALITPNHSHQPAPQFSYLGVPAATGMGDWYENGVTRPQSMPECRRPPLRHSGLPIRHSRESGNPGVVYGLQMTRKHLHQSAPRFSYLGVPAPAGMSDCYDSMSRTPIRDEFRHRPATPTTVARTTTARSRRRDVALGLVPSQGRGGVHGRHLNPSINQCT